MQLVALAALLLTGGTVMAQSIPDKSEWNFSSSYKTIDNNRYFLDETNNLAEFLINYTNSDVANSYEGTFTVPSTVSLNGVTYTVVSMKMYSWSYDLPNVTKVVLPNTLVNLGDYALAYFPNVDVIEIPASVKYLGNRVLNREWKALKFLGTTPPEVAGALASGKVKLYVPAAAFQEYKVTDYIEDCCVISDDIDTQTFHTDKVDSGELGYIVVSNQLPEIITYSDVNKLIVDEGTIDETDWYQLRQMKNLVYLDLSGLSITDMPYEALRDCWQIETVILPKTLEAIHGSAFYRTGVRNLILPESLKVIDGSYNFYDCDFLTEIAIPDGVKSLPSWCFAYCNNLHAVTLPAALETMDAYCFYDTDLYSLYIPGTLKTIPYYGFAYNENLAYLTFGEGVEVIGEYAFYNCNSLTTLNCPKSLRRIRYEAFYNSSNEKGMLSTINLNEGLEEIDGYAFAYNRNLTEITLPSSLIYCLDKPFTGCSKLQKIYTYALIPPTVRNAIPTNQAGNIELYVPQWSFQEYMTTPGWLEYQDHTAIDPDILPENIFINKEFEFVLKPEQMKEGYHPNMRMFYNSETIDDGFGHQKYERGNLTISSRSKLNVNNFTMNISPMAKLYSDYNRFYSNYNRNYDDHRTQFSPNALVVRGEMRAEHQTYNLMLCNDRWQFISFPFDVNVSDIVPVDPLTQWVIRSYDGNARANQDFDNTWVNLSSDYILEAGKGYIIKCYNNNDKYYRNWNSQSNPVEFTVVPVQKSLTTQQLFNGYDRETELVEYISEFEQNRSWNLIGNPYPCFFDTRYMETEAPFMVWDSFNETYAAFSPVDDDYVLEPGEAFFIQRPVEVDNSQANSDEETYLLRFRQDGRQTYRNPNDLTVTARAMMPSSSAHRTVINLVLSNDENSDRTRIVFNDNAKMKYETSRDAAKFMAESLTVPQLWSVGGSVQYAINERPLNDGIVELAARFGQEGSYTITLGNNSNVESVILEDHLMGTRTELSAEQGYTFSSQAGLTKGRFYIVSNSVVTGISEISNVASEAPAYNMAGQRVNSNQHGLIIKNGKKMLNK